MKRQNPGGGRPGSHRWFWLVCLGFFISAGPVRAQDEGLEGFDFSSFEGLDLEDELALLAEEDVVISATRHAQRIEDSPSAITVLTREAIRQSGAADLADLLRLVPGVDVFRMTAAQPAVGIRSNSTIAGDLVLVLVDGRIAMWPGVGQALWMAMPFDMQSVERVEVIRGPGSSIYGANAVQGVVNVVTRRPGEEPLQAEVSLQAAPGDNFEGSARLHGTLGKLGYWASAGLVRKAPTDRPWDADTEVVRARAVLERKLGEEASLRLETGAYYFGSSFYTVIGMGRWENLTPYLTAKLELPRTELQLVVDQSAVDIDVDVVLAVSLQEGAPPIELGRTPSFDVRARTVELQANHWIKLFEGNRLTFGGVAQLVNFHSKTLVSCPEGLGHETFSLDQCDPQRVYEISGGLFAQDEWRFLDSLTATVGLRLDANTTQSQPAISPRLALVWTPVENHALRLSAGRAFRRPTFLESFAHLPLVGGEAADPALVRRLQHIFATAIGNESLDYEDATSAELGYRTSLFDGKLGITLDLFLIDHANAIFMKDQDLQIDNIFGVPVISPEATLTFRNNTGSRRTAGGELTFHLEPLDWIDLTVSYGGDFLISDDQEDAPYTLEPEHRLLGILRLELPHDLNVSLDALWLSAYGDDIADPESVLADTTVVGLGAWTLVNARVGWTAQLQGGELEIGVRVFNLLGFHQRESAGLDLPEGGSFGGVRLERRATLFVEGRF